MAAAVEGLVTEREGFVYFGGGGIRGSLASLSFCIHRVGLQADEQFPIERLRNEFLVRIQVLPASECPRAYKTAPPDSILSPVDLESRARADRIHLYVSRPLPGWNGEAWVAIRVYRSRRGGLLYLCRVDESGGGFEADDNCQLKDAFRYFDARQ